MQIEPVKLKNQRENMMNETSPETDYGTNHPGYFVAGLLFGSLLGGLAGAVTMLLLAPQSGKKTRKQIRRKGRDLREQTAETIEGSVKQARTKAHHVSTGIHDQAEDLQQRGQDIVGGQKERWLPVVEAGKTAVNGS